LTRLALEEDSRGFIAHDVDVSAMTLQLNGVTDRSLAELLLHGVGVYDGGQNRPDASLVLRLYAEGIIRVLLIHHKFLRSLPVRGNVVVFGTEYRTTSSETMRKTVPYTMTELFEIQSRAVRHGANCSFHIFCQESNRSTILRLLDDGLSLESSLHEGGALSTWLSQQCREGQIRSKQDALDLLSSSYLALRLAHNPNYYDIEGRSKAEQLSRVIDSSWTIEEES